MRGAIAAGTVRLVTAATSYVTLGIAARVLTTEEFGLVAVLISFWLIVTMFDMGLGGALTTRVAVSHARDDLAGIRGHVNHALVALTAIGTLIAVGGTISAIALPWQEWIGGTLPPPTVTRSVIITFVVAGASLPAAIGVLILGGMQRFTIAQVGVAGGSLSTLVATAAVAPLDPPPDVFVLAVLGCPLAVSLGFTFWAIGGVLRGARAPAEFEADRLMSMLRASGWYALYNAGNTIMLGTGTVIVGSVRGLAEAAVFNVSIRLFSPIITVVAASGVQLWPGMTEAISRGDVAWARSRYKRGLAVVAGVSTAASITLVALGRWFAELWVGPDLIPSLNLLVWTAAFSVAVAVTSQANVLLMAVERIRIAATLSVCGAAAGMGASVILVGAVGVSGAAIGALVACAGILLPGVVLLARDTFKRLGAAADPSLKGAVS